MCRSVTTTSGRSVGTSSRSWRPLVASPTSVDGRGLGEDGAQAVAVHRVVVGDDHAYRSGRFGHALTRSAEAVSGSTASTVVPEGPNRMMQSPPAAWARARIDAIPTPEPSGCPSRRGRARRVGAPAVVGDAQGQDLVAPDRHRAQGGARVPARVGDRLQCDAVRRGLDVGGQRRQVVRRIQADPEPGAYRGRRRAAARAGAAQ